MNQNKPSLKKTALSDTSCNETMLWGRQVDYTGIRFEQGDEVMIL